MRGLLIPIDAPPEISEMCEYCPSFDMDTRECLASCIMFGDCILLDNLILPEFMPEIIDIEDDND